MFPDNNRENRSWRKSGRFTPKHKPSGTDPLTSTKVPSGTNQALTLSWGSICLRREGGLTKR